MKPYVIDHIEGADNTTVKENIPEIYADLMSKKDAKKLQKMLREVVTEGLQEQPFYTDLIHLTVQYSFFLRSTLSYYYYNRS